MIWENTKLLLGLLYRPVSSMGRIVDEGHWLYAAVVVAALSMIFHASVTSIIYNNYEAVYRELPHAEQSEAIERAAAQPAKPKRRSISTRTSRRLRTRRPPFVFEQLPLPLVGKHGWWFVVICAAKFLHDGVGHGDLLHSMFDPAGRYFRRECEFQRVVAT